MKETSVKTSSRYNVLKNSSIYSLNGILQKAIGFILLPLYARFLTLSDYGIIGVLASVITTLNLFYTLSINSSIQRFYFVYADQPYKFKIFLSTNVLFLILNSIIITILIIIFKDFFQSIFNENIMFYPYIFISILSLIFSPLFTIFQSLLQTIQKSYQFSFLNLLFFVLSVILNIVFVVGLKLGAVGQLISVLITSIFFFFLTIILLFKENFLIFKFNFDDLKKSLGYSIPLIPHLLSTSLALLTSQLLLNSQISIESAGLFNIAAKFIALIDILQVSIINAFTPWFYQSVKRIDYKKIINDFVNIIYKVFFLVSLFFLIFSKEFMMIFLPIEFVSSWKIFSYLLIGYQIKLIYMFITTGIYFSMKGVKFLFLATLSGNLLSILFSFFLTKEIGILTPSFALILQWLFTTFIVIIIEINVSPIRIKLFNKFSLVFILALIALILNFTDNELIVINFHVLLISKSLFYFVFVFLLLNKNLVFYLNFFKNFIIKYKAL